MIALKDKEFLQWIHARMVEVHGENKDFDYMGKFRAIIAEYDSEKVTPSVCPSQTK